MKKILIMGYSGSGKTTLAAKIGQKLGCRVIYIDELQFTDTFEMQDQKKVFSQINEALAQQDSWVIDGYLSQYIEDKWLEAADCVLFLNFSRWRCLVRLLKRSQSHHRQDHIQPPRPDLPPSEEKKLKRRRERPEGWMKRKNLRYLRWIFLQENRLRRQRYYFRTGERCTEKFMVVNTPKQLDAFLHQKDLI